MASTPLYKSLKTNGTSFYAFPGASEDISAAYQNSNYKMYFTKFALVNFPKQNLDDGGSTSSTPISFDFDNSFSKSSTATPTTKFGDGVVESLRNYVANQETVIRESRLNNNQYYYNTNTLETTTEKIFWKWCLKLGLIGFEPAIPDDEYYSNLVEFQTNKVNDDSYFPEYLWKEREVVNWDTTSFSVSTEAGYTNNLQIEFNGETNFRVGDTVVVYNVTNTSISQGVLNGVQTQEGLRFYVLKIIPSDSTNGQRIVLDVNVSSHPYLPNNTIQEQDGQAELVYHRLVQYVGEVSGISNVQEANRSYTEVYAHIPDHTGMTPDILFRTLYDENYRPNLSFPIVPGQAQPEIMGAENFTSPIVSTPQSYPGSYFGQFDTLDFTYETSPGDVLRRSGNYYGVTGDLNSTTVNPNKLDGLTMDFNTSHYAKMNLANRRVTNFDQFNALRINNLPPDDFEFNAILWYYAVEDDKGNSRNNLYGISFIDNPENNQTPGEAGLRFPTYSKLVANDNQDGTSFAFSLNLNFNVINDNAQDTYNPEAINSLFGMNLFNDAMKRLASTNDSFLNILADQNKIFTDIQDIKSMLYSQSDLNTLNAKMKSLEEILRLYSRMQMTSSDTIEVAAVPGTPPTVQLNNISTAYSMIDNVSVTDLYNTQGVIPLSVMVPNYQSFLVNITNDDETLISIPNNDHLVVVLERDLDYRQSVEFLIKPNEVATQNKKLDIYIKADLNSSFGNLITNNQILLVGNIDLPVFYNSERSIPNSAAKWKEFGFDIDFNSDIVLKSGSLLTLNFDTNPYMMNNSIKTGDTLYLNDFFVGTASIYDFSGQYPVYSVTSATSSQITIDMSSNPSLNNYVSSNASILPMTLHGTTDSMLSNKPYFSLNKGKRIVVTKTSPDATILSARYRIDIHDL